MRPHPVELRAAILRTLATGASVSATAHVHGVARSQVRRYREQEARTGSLVPLTAGRRRAITDGDDRLLAQLAEHPTASVRAHCWHWQQRTGEVIGRGAMGRALQRHGYVQQPKPVTPSSKPYPERASRPRPPRRDTMRRTYPTDLDDAEWARLEPLIPAAKTGGRPARDRREILDAISYVVRTGCAWRLLPHDFPPWQTVYHYYRLWRLDGTWERIHDTLREQVRQQQGREAEPSGGIIDSQSVKTTEKGGSAATTAARR
jgi:transposase/transposase-like protein